MYSDVSAIKVVLSNMRVSVYSAGTLWQDIGAVGIASHIDRTTRYSLAKQHHTTAPIRGTRRNAYKDVCHERARINMHRAVLVYSTILTLLLYVEDTLDLIPRCRRKYRGLLFPSQH